MVCIDYSAWFLKSCLCSYRFLEGFLLDVMYDDLVPLCLVTLILQTLRNSFDLGVFGGFLGKVFLRVDFDPWNESGDRLVEGLSISRGLSSSRMSRPKPVRPVSQTGLTGLALWAVVKSFSARKSLHV
jgi:hypothetical protein